MTPARLRPVLEREHRQWIQEVVAVVEPASRSDAGVWARWSALRYLQTTFPARLDQERRLVEGMDADLTDDQREILWALPELLDALRLQLGHLIGLCPSGRPVLDAGLAGCNDQAPAATASAATEVPLATASSSASASAATAPMTVTTGF